MPAPAPGLGQSADPGPHRDAHPQRPQRAVLAAHRIVEEHHQAVAREPFQRALEPEDQVAERVVVLLQHAHHLLRLARLRERGEAAQVAEDHDDLAPVAGQERLVAGVHDQLGQLRAEEPAQPAHPLQLRHLALDPRLQFLVPRGQLGSLPLDRVLVPLDPGQRRHPGEQFALVDRLGEEVVRPGLERLHLLLVAAGRHHHDRQVRRVHLVPDPPAHLVPVHPRHQDVEQDEIDVLGIDQLQRLLTRRRGQYVVPARTEDRLQQPDVRRLVVDHEHLRHVAPPESEEVPDLLR